MSETNRPDDFESQWQGKLSRAVKDRTSIEIQERVMAGGETLQDPSSSREKLLWTCGALDRLAQSTDEKTRQQILTSCHCSYPNEDLQDVKSLYQETGQIDLVLKALQTKFERFLREALQLEEELIDIIVQQGWGLAGVRQGDTILATKIPKSSYLKAYFEAEDPLEKRRLYCHCPRVRDELGADPGLPPVYCYCGAGFYQGIWEEILERPVEAEVLESVLNGGDVCQIAIHL